ncbi:MAG: trigger factor [Clostridia bacterium]|jgi:trigger factor
MNYNVGPNEKSKIAIEVSLTKEEWQKEIEQSYNKNKGKYNVAGFRKGKVPRNILERNFGADIFYEDAFNGAFYNSYTEILDKELSINPISNPNIDIKEINEQGLKFVIEITNLPEVKLAEYKGHLVERKQHEVTDEEINKKLTDSQEKLARYETVERQANTGDTVCMDFSGSVNGVAFEGGTAKNYDLELGSGSFISGFEEQVVGMKAGDQKDITVKFPDNYYSTELAGKDAVFNVKINLVKEKQLPELTDEFASNASEFSTLTEYKNNIKANLEEQNKKSADIEAENKLIEKIVEGSVVEVPEELIEKQIDHIMHDLEHSLMYQGFSMQDYIEYNKTTLDALRARHHDQAIKTVKSRLVLDAIVKAENITITNEEFDKKIEEDAKKVNKNTKDYIASLKREQLDYIRSGILTKKLITLLHSNNEIK